VTRVLVAEDNPINREIMLSQLTALGYTVAEAASGKEALSKYQAGLYDLVLTDIEMPELDGYGLAAEIRRLEQDGRPRTPFRPGRSPSRLRRPGCHVDGGGRSENRFRQRFRRSGPPRIVTH
jgi:CheY-like chemotaxis protein